jgi:hypothetical protein
MKKIVAIRVVFISAILALIQSCTSYTTNFNVMEKLKDPGVVEIKKGMTCSKNVFGGFSLPWIGDTAIMYDGDQSVIAAIKDAQISHVYAYDFYSKHYVFHSTRCTIVYGY